MAAQIPKPDPHRVPLLFSAEELKELDDWQFQHRHRSRTAAIKALMQIGYETSKAPAAEVAPSAGSAAQDSRAALPPGKPLRDLLMDYHANLIAEDPDALDSRSAETETDSALYDLSDRLYTLLSQWIGRDANDPKLAAIHAAFDALVPVPTPDEMDKRRAAEKEAEKRRRAEERKRRQAHGGA